MIDKLKQNQSVDAMIRTLAEQNDITQGEAVRRIVGRVPFRELVEHASEPLGED